MAGGCCSVPCDVARESTVMPHSAFNSANVEGEQWQADVAALRAMLAEDLRRRCWLTMWFWQRGLVSLLSVSHDMSPLPAGTGLAPRAVARRVLLVTCCLGEVWTQNWAHAQSRCEKFGHVKLSAVSFFASDVRRAVDCMCHEMGEEMFQGTKIQV